MKILQSSDRITVTFKSFKVVLKPLTYWERTELESFNKIVSGESVTDWNKVLFYTMKYSIVDIIGLTDFNDKPISIERDGEYISDSVISDIFNSGTRQDIINSINLMTNNPEKLIKGVDLEGVESVQLGNLPS
jgi:hypothetical protein